ncbi:MAG TPA: cobalt chelatase [Verrucomicrobia bacterium]|nr:MAG: hypothetical protein A2X46_04210 [Lentisphaerae bacterium GWF2_57_35]HBA84688.1 cobalt chelatase [Verrucomicrobiota bacterium]
MIVYMRFFRWLVLGLSLLVPPAALAGGGSFLVIGAWDRALPVFERAAAETGIQARFISGDEAGQLTAQELKNLDVVLVLNLSPQTTGQLRDALLEARTTMPGLKILSLDQRDTQKDLDQAGVLEHDAAIPKYWRYTGVENLRRMIRYIQAKHLSQPGEVLPPVVVPDFGIYHPAASNLFGEINAYVQWAQSNGRLMENAPRVALLVQQSFVVTEDTKVYDAVIEAFEKRGIGIGVFFAAELSRLQELLSAWKPELLIDDAHASPAALQSASVMDIPHMKQIAMLRATMAEWEASPLGLPFQDVSLHLLTQELYGIIDPVVVGGLKVNLSGYRIHEPIPERIERLADRAQAWLNLRHKANADKRIAIVYYNKYLGQADLARGTPSGAFLDGPESLVRLLRAMKAQGYTIHRMPKDSAELIQWMKKEGRNIGNWAPGDLEQLVTNSSPEMITPKVYEGWFSTLSDKNRAAVTEKFGPAPGNQMIFVENGQKLVVLPKIDLGNVILMPQPARGPENDAKLLHDRSTPPPHQYLAFYWWLQKGFKADAIIHFGTHGSELLLPMKANGLSKDDYGDICIGAMPNITPWIIDNAAEGALAKRRAYAVLIDHLTPPIEGAGLSGALKNLDNDIDKFQGLEAGILKEKFRSSITEAAAKTDFGITTKDLLADDEIQSLAAKLHEIHNQIAPMKLHVLGEAPDEKHLPPFIVSMLGRKLLNELAGSDARARAEAMITRLIQKGSSPELPEKYEALAKDYLNRFTHTTNEIEYILHALAGRFVPPGPCNDPVRNPGAIPTGRNMYTVNPEEIPTKQAWEIGVALVDDLLKTHQLKKVAFDLNAFETMRDFGVMEAQILYLMGLRPIWDANNLAVDVEVIPAAELKRPRIDVFIAISGTMRDNFPSRIQLLDKAVRLVSAIDENDNFVRENTKNREKSLLERNFSPKMAEKYASARIFGQKPGEYGTKILYLIPKSGSWNSEQEVANVYIENMSYVFTGDVWGEKVEGLYEQAVQGSELILRTWASNMLSPLSNHHVYEYAGGLNLAIKTVTGKEAELVLNDVRDEPRLRNFEDALRVEFHATLFNKKWTQGMMENGYAGAGMVAELVKNTFGWKVTRPGSIDNNIWNQIHEIYVKDQHGLKLREWMDRENPHAFQEIAATLLESNRKGYWKTDPKTLDDLARQYAESVAHHGDSGGLVGGGNLQLQKQVEQRLDAPGDQPLKANYQREIARAKGKPGPDRVAGPKLEPQTKQEQETATATNPLLLGAIVTLLLLCAGFRKKIGSPS